MAVNIPSNAAFIDLVFAFDIKIPPMFSECGRAHNICNPLLRLLLSIIFFVYYTKTVKQKVFVVNYISSAMGDNLRRKSARGDYCRCFA